MEKLLKMFGKSKKQEKVEKQEKNEKHVENIETRNNFNINNTNIEQQQSSIEKKFDTAENTSTFTSKNYENLQTKENFLSNNINTNTETGANILPTQILTKSSIPSSFSLTHESNIEKANDVVLVNAPEDLKKSKLEGFYYRKYINKIQKLSISNPILVEREKMKINFDSEVMDYLMNDLSLIFKEKQNIIDRNQENIIEEIQESRDLIGVMLGIHNDATFNYSLDFFNKQQRFMKDVDYLEVIVNTLNTEVDGLIAQMDMIENKLNSSHDKSSKEGNGETENN